ncbi:DUF6538 domain-containing protein [Aquabacterium sp.]|uniref:DUF6538 domain-containing protein n=1 Tax=Aquabacterium sp. TaxID=1872578 RepID=UPI003D038FE1
MHGLQRRPSGIYVARLVIPVHLRARFRRTEFIQSTGSRDRALAKAIACELVAAWRVQTDLLRLQTEMRGSPFVLKGPQIVRSTWT